MYLHYFSIWRNNLMHFHKKKWFSSWFYCFHMIWRKKCAFRNFSYFELSAIFVVLTENFDLFSRRRRNNFWNHLFFLQEEWKYVVAFFWEGRSSKKFVKSKWADREIFFFFIEMAKNSSNRLEQFFFDRRNKKTLKVT